jgi:acyl dehydratase
MKTFYFEDLEIGQLWESPAYLVTRDEMIAFASRWSPQPYYIDEEAASRSIYGTLVACESYLFAIMISLVDKLEDQVFLLAGLGVRDIKFPQPVCHGDRIRLRRQVLDKQISKTKTERGVITFEHLLKNQEDHVVYDSVHKLLVGCRPSSIKGKSAV